MESLSLIFSARATAEKAAGTNGGELSDLAWDGAGEAAFSWMEVLVEAIVSLLSPPSSQCVITDSHHF